MIAVCANEDVKKVTPQECRLLRLFNERKMRIGGTFTHEIGLHRISAYGTVGRKRQTVTNESNRVVNLTIDGSGGG